MSRIQRCGLRTAGVVAVLLSLATTARAAEPTEASDPALALIAGGAFATASLGVGVVALSRSETRSGKNAGLLGGQAGLTLAPVLAHALVGELDRGALFALIPLAGLLANASLAAAAPDFIAHGGPPIQSPQ